MLAEVAARRAEGACCGVAAFEAAAVGGWIFVAAAAGWLDSGCVVVVVTWYVAPYGMAVVALALSLAEIYAWGAGAWPKDGWQVSSVPVLLLLP